MCVRMLPRAGQTAVFVRDKTQKIYLIATIKPRGPGVTWYMYIMPQINRSDAKCGFFGRFVK